MFTYAAKSAAGLGKRRSAMSKHSGIGHMQWPIIRTTRATGQTNWPIARVKRTTSPSTRPAGHLRRASGQLAWPIVQVSWTGGQQTRTLPARVHSSPASFHSSPVNARSTLVHVRSAPPRGHAFLSKSPALGLMCLTGPACLPGTPYRLSHRCQPLSVASSALPRITSASFASHAVSRC